MGLFVYDGLGRCRNAREIPEKSAPNEIREMLCAHVCMYVCMYVNMHMRTYIHAYITASHMLNHVCTPCMNVRNMYACMPVCM